MEFLSEIFIKFWKEVIVAVMLTTILPFIRVYVRRQRAKILGFLREWEFITNEFSHAADWDNILEVEPDEIDLQMLKEIRQDNDCHEFISSDEAEKMLGLT